MTNLTARGARVRRWAVRRGLVLFSLAFAGAWSIAPGGWVVTACLLAAAGWGAFVMWMQGRPVLHEKVDRLNEGISELLDASRETAAPAARPELYVVRHD